MVLLFATVFMIFHCLCFLMFFLVLQTLVIFGNPFDLTLIGVLKGMVVYFVLGRGKSQMLRPNVETKKNQKSKVTKLGLPCQAIVFFFQ